MSTPGPLFRPFNRLIKITIRGKEVEIPENNMLLRGFQYLAPENVAHGRFCWNEECQYCRVTYDLGEGAGNGAYLLLTRFGAGAEKRTAGREEVGKLVPLALRSEKGLRENRALSAGSEKRADDQEK
jgi:hypothetical protein